MVASAQILPLGITHMNMFNTNYRWLHFMIIYCAIVLAVLKLLEHTYSVKPKLSSNLKLLLLQIEELSNSDCRLLIPRLIGWSSPSALFNYRGK